MSDLFAKLNPEQKQAASHVTGPALVLAGAGSGKTTVLTHRAANLIQNFDVHPENILLVTFTNKAAGEMKERIELLTGMRLPWAGTFHSICARILRRHGHYVGLDNNFVIYDTEDQKSLVKKLYKDHNFNTKAFKPNSVRGVISAQKNELIGPRDFAEIAVGEFQQFTARFYRLYQDALAEANAADFDDLLFKTVRLLQLNESVRKQYQDLFRFILVDEYQDTNTSQYELTKLLAAPQQNLFVVGDFSQSIYAWRGANYRNMLQLKTDFPDMSEYRLERNYRSTQHILDAATAVISHNKAHPILTLWTEKDSGSKLKHLDTASSDHEALKVIRLIRQHSDALPLSEIAILYRTNAQSRSFEEALIRSGIPYKLIGGTKFYERKEVKDVLAYLRVLINPADTVSEARALGLGKRRFADFETLRSRFTGDALMETPPAELLKEILEVTKYQDKYDSEIEEERQRLENIAELVTMAAQFESAALFLENVALLQDNIMADSDREVGGNSTQDSVQLMSLHSAKGLEFAVVFMVGMEDGLLPHSHSMLSPDDIEEERRLCYVGITRAKEYLYLTSARSRFLYGTRSGTVASRFLAAIPATILERESDYDESDSYASNGYNRNSGYNRGNYYSSGKPQKTTPQSSERRIVVDEDMAEAALRGDIDLEVFLRS